MVYRGGAEKIKNVSEREKEKEKEKEKERHFPCATHAHTFGKKAILQFFVLPLFF